MLDGLINRKKVAIIGTGISGLSAAWLLSQRHDVTVYEKAERIGGHSNTVDAPIHTDTIPVDIGFIVYNEKTYPNLTALFDLLKVPTRRSEMSFSVSLDDGAFEYSGTSLAGLFARRRNMLSPRFWAMLQDLRRFYREAARDLPELDETGVTLGAYLAQNNYGKAFRDDHLLPMAAAIWSAPPDAMMNYPASAFIRFQRNHGLLQVTDRPPWRTVVGGSRAYVQRLTERFKDRIRTGVSATSIQRAAAHVDVRDAHGETSRFDDVVIATHADDALRLLADPTAQERALLGAFRYSRNIAVLHTDARLMPKRTAAWSSWNFIGRRGGDASADVSVSYWMNRLQGLETRDPLVVTLNPARPPRAGRMIHRQVFEHPLFDCAAMAAQQQLWNLQGRRNTWFCGAYFGAGFHEDGLQAGLAVAEELGGLRRPWTVEDESGRIVRHPIPHARADVS